MPSTNEFLDESTVVIQEIESNLEKALQKRKDEVEHELQEKIRREKEESERKLSEIETEFEKDRGTIKEFRGLVSEFESARQTLKKEIEDHLQRAMRYQQDIEKLTSLTLAELNKVDELSQQLVDLRQSSERRVAEIRSRLQDRFGIPGPAPSRPEPVEVPESDLEQELIKLKRIKQLLEEDTLSAETAPDQASPEAVFPEAGVREADGPPVPSEPESRAAEPGAAASPRVDFKMPEINQFIEDFMKREPSSVAGPDALHEIPEPLPEEIPKAMSESQLPEVLPDGIAGAGHGIGEPKPETPPGDEPKDLQAVFQALDPYRKTESVDDAHDITYYQKGPRTILDGESLVRAGLHVLLSGRKLLQKLGQTDSPKDQFFIKQELINDQETLRKVVLRAVKMCDKESASLPHFTADVLNLGVLKDILDRLTLDNWSNPDSFKAFDVSFEQLKETFSRMTTPPANYLRSILDELER
jgi:hypothetical protein